MDVLSDHQEFHCFIYLFPFYLLFFQYKQTFSIIHIFSVLCNEYFSKGKKCKEGGQNNKFIEKQKTTGKQISIENIIPNY